MGAHILTRLRLTPAGADIPPVLTDQSRNDVLPSYYVLAESVDTADTYSWNLSFTPESSGPLGTAPPAGSYSRVSSNATLSSTTAKQTMFQVDFEGSYLLRLVVNAGLATEEVVFVRLRVMTQFAELFLVSAGERRDESGTIPVDVDAQGWANEQNSNIQRLMLLTRRAAKSGRVLYVDANRGRGDPAAPVPPVQPLPPPNDPSVLVRMPGTDISNSDETGMRMAARNFGDFAYINDAIAYAVAAPSRGEPALGPFNPYIIKLAPGMYEEDITLVPHVHLFADEGSLVLPAEPDGAFVISVSILNASASHQFTGGSAGDITYLKGILFQNQIDMADPVFHQRGGILIFDCCHIIQNGSDPFQGPLVTSEIGPSGPTDFPGLALFDCFSLMQGGHPSFISYHMKDGGLLYGRNSSLWGDSTVVYNTNWVNTPFGGEVRFENCWVRSMVSGASAFRGYPGTFVCSDSEFDNEDALTAPILSFDLIDATGASAPAGTVSYDLNLYINTSDVDGDINTQVDQTIGDVNLHPSSLRVSGEYLFPAGAPNEWTPRTNSTSVNYDNAYTDPLEPVSPPTTLPTNKVQNAIDMLIGAALPLGTPPYFSLDSAYDGLSDLQPFTRGAGLGRVITADEGAVKIGGALYPSATWLSDEILTGGLQAEGNVDIGPLVDSSPPLGALDNLGSEINLRAGVVSGAAMLTMGRTATADGLTDHRGLPAGIVMGGNPNAANAVNGHLPFNLHLRTRNNYNSDTDELGRVVMGGGEAYPDFGSVGAGGTKGGGVYLQGGTCYQPSAGPPYPEEGGFIFLAPGMATDTVGNSTPSKIRICLLDNSVAWANLTAGQAFVPGGEGTFWLSGINGMEQFTVSATDLVADVINTINQSSYQFVASNSGGDIIQIVSTTPGPNGDVMFSGCIPLTLNADHLRDLDVGSGATFTPGDYNDFVDISCTGAGALEVDGDFNVTGTITQAGAPCCGGGGGGPTLNHQQIIFNVPAPPQPINATARLVGVVNTGFVGGQIVTLPVPAVHGREVTVKDESGTAGLFPVLIQTADASTIDMAAGVPGVALAGNLQSFRFYYNALAPLPGWYLG